MKSAQETYNIYYDNTLDVVVMEWRGYATSHQFREGTELMLNTLIQNKCTKVLADIRSMTIIGMEDQQWLERDFLPRAIRFGFKMIAIITPASYFNKIAVENVSYKVDKKHLGIHFFDSVEQGKDWLHKS